MDYTLLILDQVLQHLKQFLLEKEILVFKDESTRDVVRNETIVQWGSE